MTRLGDGRRVLLAIDHRRNAELLEAWLADGHGFSIADDGGPVDIAVVDGAAFERLRDELRALRERERPAWLPVLLVVEHRLAQRLDDGVWEVADEVITTPIRQSELALRVQRVLALRERSIALARRLDELGRSNVDLEQFAYVAAHELSTPLAVVTGAVETIAAREREKLDPTLRPLLDAATAESVRLQGLIHDLLAFSQAERDGGATQVALADVLAEALQALAPQIAANEAEVEAHPLPSVGGDPRQLRIVFTNLVGNAIKYRAPDAAPRVRITCEETTDDVVVSVEDNGVGVANSRAKAIFEMFERSDTGRASGHGIGLALCRRIVERHDGRIWVEPGAERGSVFRFRLPKR